MKPPYSITHICDTVIHSEIKRIYQAATRVMKAVYDLAHDNDRGEEDNWVIRWMLWHVSRYRDKRNKYKRSVNLSEGEAGGPPSPEERSPTTTSQPSER